MIFDAHYHLSGSQEFILKNVAVKNVIFNSVAEYRLRKSEIQAPDTSTLIFDFKENFEFCKREIESSQVNALKIHTRIQRITRAEYPRLLSKLSELNPYIPIVIDAFYHGPELDFQPSIELVLQVAKALPNNAIVVAHAGGHQVLDYQLHLKDLHNVFFELSFSLQYLRYTSAFQNFKNLIRHSRKKLLFGTDFPNASPEIQFDLLTEILSEQQVSEEEKELLFYQNAMSIFKPSTNSFR